MTLSALLGLSVVAAGLAAGPASASAITGTDSVAWVTAVGGLQYHPPDPGGGSTAG